MDKLTLDQKLEQLRKETYTLAYGTELEIKKAEKLRQRLYNKFNSVNVVPDGFGRVKIIASN